MESIPLPHTAHAEAGGSWVEEGGMYGWYSARTLAALVVATLVVGVDATAAHADPVKCKAAIIKGAAAFVQAKAKALAKCEEAMVKGKLPTGDCHADVKASATIAKAVTKLNGAVAKACGGKDKLCGTADDDSLASIDWTGPCPNFENGGCNAAITDCSGISACLSCIGEATTDRAIGIAYDALVPTDPKAQKDLNKCQVAIGKASAAFYVAKSKALAKCWGSVNSNKATNPCPVPGDGKAAAAIAKAETKKRATICKACGGADKLCNGVGDVTPTAIGFPAQCPSATIPNGAVCDHAIATLDDLVDCVDCINEYAVDCADRSAVPAFVSPYPPECNPVAGPTPTATLAPTATPTATATATETVTPTPTESPTPTATESPTPTATSTEATPTATESPTPTATSTEATPTATATESPTPSESPTPTATATATETGTPTPTATETPVPTPTETATEVPTPTETETPTPTDTATPTETATETPTPTPTATAGLSDAITSTPTLGDFWGIDPSGLAQNPPTTIPRQRVSNGGSLTIAELGLCLGLQLGSETGTIHFEIWDDQTVGCALGEASCPGTKLGGDSDPFAVDGLASLQGNGACDSANNGESVTIKWAANNPAPTGNFWIVGVNDSSGGIQSGQVRWGASAFGVVDAHADTDFDSWKNLTSSGVPIDNDNDFYFIVRTGP
jgi:hypothetical protein